MGFVENKFALKQNFSLQALRFSPPNYNSINAAVSFLIIHLSYYYSMKSH
jgi:hypothetical protein